jgi:hypothetical protein
MGSSLASTCAHVLLWVVSFAAHTDSPQGVTMHVRSFQTLPGLSGLVFPALAFLSPL